jgi:hypothetical protein
MTILFGTDKERVGSSVSSPRVGRRPMTTLSKNISTEGPLNCRSLHFGRDDKRKGGAPIERLVSGLQETAGPSTTLPRISCGTWWRCCISCAFPLQKGAHAAFPVLRGRKSEYAPVGMTILLGADRRTSRSSLSSAWVGRRPMFPPVGICCFLSFGKDKKRPRLLAAFLV